MQRTGSETRVTDPTTGGQKGQKPERFSLLPFEALDEVLRAYHYGSTKYSDHNWRKGYKWSLSFDACMRHLTAFWMGEDKDEESGLSHLAHAGWHVLCLLWFWLNGKGMDDRWQPEVAAQAYGKQEVSGLVSAGERDSMVGSGDLDYLQKLAKDLAETNDLDPKDHVYEVYDPIAGCWVKLGGLIE